jgi:hypothetical protein
MDEIDFCDVKLNALSEKLIILKNLDVCFSKSKAYKLIFFNFSNVKAIKKLSPLPH